MVRRDFAKNGENYFEIFSKCWVYRSTLGQNNPDVYFGVLVGVTLTEFSTDPDF